MDEFEKRLKAAKKARTKRVVDDGYQVYKYCFNGREDEWRHTGRARSRDDDAEEIFADVVANVAEDFSGELFHVMTPENTPWVKYETPYRPETEDVKKELEEALEQREAAVSGALKTSNYYDEGPSAFQDAAFGTVCLWVERYGFSQPISCEAVPASRIYTRLGPGGKIDDRFRESSYAAMDIPQLFPDGKFSKKLERIIEKGTTDAKVMWGFWQNWEDVSNPIWVQNIRVNGEGIGLDHEIGPIGSCPMLVGRFGAVPGSPWGMGPARRNIRQMNVLDELVRMNLESMDHALDPAIIYPNDGALDLSEGIEAGMGYPSMPGSADSVRELFGGKLDYGFFSQEHLEEAVRDAFYREATQRGKTPPSASQYVGETQKQIRRMSRPAGKLWTELGVALLKRIEFLELEAGGSLEGAEASIVIGDEKNVAIRPISPLERAQASEDIMMSQSIIEMTASNLGPEQAALLIDGPKTMINIKEKAQDQLVEFRTQEQIGQIVAAASGAQGGNQEKS